MDHNYSCHCWLIIEKKIVIGTEEGNLILMNEDCKYETLLSTSPYYINKK
jgi:hypothetical protein